ncbi:tetratricopeptide repeat protein [bacterium]|nr:tetratricopeptide repeat protein [bacterium]
MNQKSSTPLRKLAAIMFTDIAGFTKAMSADEESTLALLRKKRSIIKPLISGNNGTFVKEIGDGTLSYFPSAIDAATCAVKLQQATYDDADMNLRIGVHVGDIVFDDEDVFGDGVNVAARLESMAPIGGVCVSKSVFEELLNKKEFDGVPLGLQQLKGVGRLIDVFALKAKNLIHPDPREYEEHKVEPHSGEEVPSVAVLPLKNKGKEEDAFYAYGVTSDLITDLSRAGKIRVASMDDIEVADAVNLSSREAAQKLFVRYIVTGMLWKHGDMFQLSIEMIDVKDKTLVWSDRWQEQWEELATIKDKIAENLIQVLNTGVFPSGIGEHIQSNTEAYEYYLKGKYRYEKRQNIEDIELARGLYQKAIDLDNNQVFAKTELGRSFFNTGDYEKADYLYQEALAQSTKIGDKKALGISMVYIGELLRVKHNYDEALDYFKRSFDLFNDLGDKRGVASSLSRLGAIHRAKQKNDEAQSFFKKSLKIFEELGDAKGQAELLERVGQTYESGKNPDTALNYYKKSLEIFEKIESKQGIGRALDSIGGIYGWDISSENGDYVKAIHYYQRSLEMKLELGNRRDIAYTFFVIGDLHAQKGEFDKALSSLLKSHELNEELDDDLFNGIALTEIGGIYTTKGENDKALEYTIRAVEVTKKHGDDRWIGNAESTLGKVYLEKGDFQAAAEYLEGALATKKEVVPKSIAWVLRVTIMLYLAQEKLGIQFDIQIIAELIEKAKNLDFELCFYLYKLTNEARYVEIGYQDVNEIADGLEDGKKFLNYPIPKAIVDAWESIEK